ncbi:MAG: TIGR02757 family protein, partial [Bacteroidales bacterium]|nr:TIGR02757 family protein [Bacteroidales bacterium]
LYAAIFAWGRRDIAIRKTLDLITLMDNAPYDFHTQAAVKELVKFDTFAHRTFQSDDVLCFVQAIRHQLEVHGSLEKAFAGHLRSSDIGTAIHRFRHDFFSLPHLKRSEKHLPDPLSGSAAKRFNLYLRWMVRKDDAGVDFGIWDDLTPAILQCPLDVHSSRVARRLGLLSREVNDWRAVEELTSSLRQIDPKDPIRFDFALFGLGIFENF